jgi:hypothetical protein
MQPDVLFCQNVESVSYRHAAGHLSLAFLYKGAHFGKATDENNDNAGQSNPSWGRPKIFLKKAVALCETYRN